MLLPILTAAALLLQPADVDDDPILDIDGTRVDLCAFADVEDVLAANIGISVAIARELAETPFEVRRARCAQASSAAPAPSTSQRPTTPAPTTSRAPNPRYPVGAPETGGGPVERPWHVGTTTALLAWLLVAPAALGTALRRWAGPR